MLDRSWYNTLRNDSGQNADGTIWKKEDVDALMDAIDAELARLDAVDRHVSGVFERNRVTALGSWKDVPYNPADYLAVGGGTWSVPQAAVVRNRYTLIGETVFWALYISWFTQGTFVPSVITGAVNRVQIALPPGLTTHFSQGVPLALAFDGGLSVDTLGLGGGTHLDVGKVDLANWTPGPIGFVGTLALQLA